MYNKCGDDEQRQKKKAQKNEVNDSWVDEWIEAGFFFSLFLMSKKEEEKRKGSDVMNVWIDGMGVVFGFLLTWSNTSWHWLFEKTT